jgi:hypothetical protein
MSAPILCSIFHRPWGQGSVKSESTEDHDRQTATAAPPQPAASHVGAQARSRQCNLPGLGMMPPLCSMPGWDVDGIDTWCAWAGGEPLPPSMPQARPRPPRLMLAAMCAHRPCAWLARWLLLVAVLLLSLSCLMLSSRLTLYRPLLPPADGLGHVCVCHQPRRQRSQARRAVLVAGSAVLTPAAAIPTINAVVSPRYWGERGQPPRRLLPVRAARGPSDRARRPPLLHGRGAGGALQHLDGARALRRAAAAQAGGTGGGAQVPDI